MPDSSHDPSQEPCAPLSDQQDKTLAPLVLEGFLRREALAEQLGLSPRTIDRWEAQRKGPPRVCVGRTILYKIQSVREWLSSQEQQPFATKRRRTFSRVRL
jgi:predicted DNA-binding transcriptional regulator AlpA